MDDEIGGNQRRRERREEDRTNNRRRQTNETNQVVNETQNNDEHLPLSLSLGPASNSSQIPPMTSSFRLESPPRFAQPMIPWPSPDYMARALSRSYFTTLPPPLPYLASSSLSNSHHQTGSRLSSSMMQPRVNIFPPSSSAPPSNQTPGGSVRSLTSTSESSRSLRSQSSRNRKKNDTIPPPYMASSSLSNSLHHTGFRLSSSVMQPPVNFFPPSTSAPPSNQTPAGSARSLTSTSRSTRSFRSQSNRNRIKDETIPPPFPWATNKRGMIQSLENLASKQITIITGDVQCKHCEKVYQVSYNLREKFSEVENIFAMEKRLMRDRAPRMWKNPEPARCELCGREKAVKPVIAARKSKINWLFLLLGQNLGYCTLEQLKNFCKHSRCHRTGAKNRLLYLTYMSLCNMLQPNRQLFNRRAL